jgi:mannose-6-phosphate isomerase-like protein (cupin superfamily)
MPGPRLTADPSGAGPRLTADPSGAGPRLTADPSGISPRLAAYPLGRHVLHVAERGVVTALPMTADFWSDMPAIFGSGRMLSVLDQTRDWPVWERHPAGDEIIWMLDGRIRLRTENLGQIDMQPNDCVLMPKGEWHTADVLEPGRALFLTEGEGSESRAR